MRPKKKGPRVHISLGDIHITPREHLKLFATAFGSGTVIHRAILRRFPGRRGNERSIPSRAFKVST